MACMQKPMTLSLTSGKGGVGKTSLSVNLAFAISQKGQSVLVVDGDLGLANVDVLLGLSVGSTIRDVLQNGADPLESVIYLERNLGILPASSGVPDMVSLGPEEQAQLAAVLTSVGSNFEYVFIDTGAGIGPPVLWFNRFVQNNIVVLSPDPTSLTDAYALIKILSRDYQIDRFYLVLNFVGSDLQGRQTYENLRRVTRKFLNLDLEYLGNVPEDRTLQKAVRAQLPFVQKYPLSKAAQAVFTLADRIQTLQERSK